MIRNKSVLEFLDDYRITDHLCSITPLALVFFLTTIPYVVAKVIYYTVKMWTRDLYLLVWPLRRDLKYAFGVNVPIMSYIYRRTLKATFYNTITNCENLSRFIA